jgi:hypothetical protein
MQIKKLVLALTVAFGFLQSSQAQSKVIVKSYAFSKEINYGKERKDPQGNIITRHDTAYFLYLEVAGNTKPVVTGVSYNSRIYDPAVYSVSAKEMVAGIKKGTNQKVTLSKGKTNSLWKIELNPVDNQKHKTSGTSKSMIVTGSIKNKPFKLTITKPVVLAPDIVG